jgi:hypothetical protein
MVVLIGLGLWDFFKEKKPLLLPVLLILPAIGVVLSYAGRRMIRNSEGTRTGEKLVNSAWWVCIVGGLGYAAYLMAIDFSVRRDATNEVEKWVGNILKDDPNSAIHVDMNRAFIATLDPDRRRNLLADDQTQLETEFRDAYLAFKQCDLVRIVQRNKNECEFVPDGLMDWIDRSNGVDCLFTGTLKCREGIFPLQIPLKGFEAGASSQATRRQWLLIVPPSGLFVQDKIKRTAYGWTINELEKSGVEVGKEFLFRISNGPTAFYPETYHLMIGSEARLTFWNSISQTTFGRWALSGGPAIMAPFFTPESEKYFRDDFFKLPGGGEPGQDQKTQFKKAWDILGLIPPGMRLKTNPDKFPTTAITENAIEVRLPCELPMPGSGVSAARCRLLIVCTDPAVVADVKRLRDEAKPDQVAAAPPDNLHSRNIKWRIVRVETDLIPIEYVSQQRPSMPSPPGMPGAGQ